MQKRGDGNASSFLVRKIPLDIDVIREDINPADQRAEKHPLILQ